MCKNEFIQLYSNRYFVSVTVVSQEAIAKQLEQMHWDIMKLLSLGVSEEWLKETDMNPQQTKDLLKGLLYLRERNKDLQENHPYSLG